MAIYPVFQMAMTESKAIATSEYKGKKYYFCAAGCQKAFDQNPEKYLVEEKKQRQYQRQSRGNERLIPRGQRVG